MVKRVLAPGFFLKSADSVYSEDAVGHTSFPWNSQATMRKFDYRAPRFPVDLPVRLTLASSTQLGRCTEISTEGMRVDLSEPLPPDSFGVVSLTYESLTLEIGIRVTHAKSNYDGLKFLYESDEQRLAVAHLVSLVTASRKGPGPVLVS
jgi:hypothetical protein